MWPERGEALSRTLDAEDVLARLYAEAIDSWVPSISSMVVPSLTAASTPPPDPSAVAQDMSGLDRLLDELILSGLSTLYCLAIIEALEGIGIELPDIPFDLDLSDLEWPNNVKVEVPRVFDVFTEQTQIDRDEIAEAVARVWSDPYLRAQTADFVDTQREIVANTAPLIEGKVAAAVRDARPPKADGETSVDVTIERMTTAQREAAARVIAPGSTELVDVAQLQSYQAAGVQNAAVIRAAQLSPDAALLEKTWIATLDGKTRDSHFAADGQRAPLTGSFSVGVTELAFPGDPAGLVSEVRNCRCRVGVLAADEEIPDEVDRHTERLGGRDSVARNRQGSQRDEIERRAADGVIRARDDEDGKGRTASGGWVAPSEQEYGMKVKRTGQTMAADNTSEERETFRTFTDQPVAFIGIETSDGRMLAEDIELTVRTPPLPAMWCKKSGYGHMDAFTVGVGEAFRVEGDRILASGYWLNTAEADESFATAERKVSRPSVDLAATEWKLVDENGKEISEEEWWDLPIDATVIQCITKAELIGFTMVATPAFGDTMIEFNDERESRDLALVASAAEEFRPRVWAAELFRRTPDQYLTEPTEIQMDPATGRIFGHLACYGSCHRSLQSECVTAPHSPSDYAQFHTSPAVRLDDGTRLPVGRLTVGTGHAPDTLGGAAAVAHYDNTGTCWALVRAFETPVGIEITGVAAPWATAEQIEMGLSAPISGDWRDFGLGLDLVAGLAVNTPGFAVRGREDEYGRPAALVASLMPRGKRRDDVQLTAESIAEITANAVRAALSQERVDNEIDALLAAAAEKLGPEPEKAEPQTPDDEIDAMLAQAGL